MALSRQVRREFNASFSIELEYCILLATRPAPTQGFGLAFGPIMCGAAAESGLRCDRESCCVHDLWCVRFIIVTVVAASIALAGCASDGTPASTGDSGSVGSFVRDLFRSNNEDQPPVPHNEVPQVASNEAPAGPL